MPSSSLSEDWAPAAGTEELSLFVVSGTEAVRSSGRRVRWLAWLCAEVGIRTPLQAHSRQAYPDIRRDLRRKHHVTILQEVVYSISNYASPAVGIMPSLSFFRDMVHGLSTGSKNHVGLLLHVLRNLASIFNPLLSDVVPVLDLMCLCKLSRDQVCLYTCCAETFLTSTCPFI